MRMTWIARVAVPAAVAASFAGALPSVAHAATESKLTPDAPASQVQTIAGETLTFATAASRPIRSAALVTVAFDGGDIKQTWTDQSNPTTLPNGVQNNSTLCIAATAAHPTCVDGQSQTAFPTSSSMQVSVPTTLADGSYELLATAWPMSCPDNATLLAPAPQSCTQDSFSGVVPDSNGNPFVFTVDDTAPAAPVVQAPASITAANVQAVPITGTAEAGSNVVVTIASSAGGPILYANPGGTVADASGTWAISPNLATLRDGTLTVNVTATDVAGNTSAAGTPATAPVLAAHPTAPQNLRAYPRDGSVILTWTAPSATGGAAINGYRVVTSFNNVAVSQQTVAASQNYAIVSGLTNGGIYNFAVAARTAVADGAAAVTSAKPMGSPVIRLVSTSWTLTYGQATTLIGRVTLAASGSPLAQRAVTITSVYDNGAAGPTYRSTTDDFGYWRVLGVRPARNIRFFAHFAGDAGDLPATSPTARVLVRAAVRFTKIAASSRSHTSPVTLSGAVGPNERGRRVYLYEVVGSRLVLRGYATLSSSSTWAWRHSFSAGTHYLLARFLNQNGVLGNTSSKVKIVRL